MAAKQGTARTTANDGDVDAFLAAVGFSPRKAAMTVYVMEGFEAHVAELERLGPHSTSKSCLYLKDLEKNDLDALARILRRSFEAHTAQRPAD